VPAPEVQAAAQVTSEEAPEEGNAE
jgi:hypothetical protein